MKPIVDNTKWCGYYSIRLFDTTTISRHVEKRFGTVAELARRSCRSPLAILFHRHQLLRKISIYDQTLLYPNRLAYVTCGELQGLRWDSQLWTVSSLSLPPLPSTPTALSHLPRESQFAMRLTNGVVEFGDNFETAKIRHGTMKESVVHAQEMIAPAAIL